MVRVSNDKGVGVVPAYVTSRVMPGMVIIHHGGNYEPDKDGVDWGCTPNLFLTDPESPVTAPLVSNLVQVERYSGNGRRDGESTSKKAPASRGRGRPRKAR